MSVLGGWPESTSGAGLERWKGDFVRRVGIEEDSMGPLARLAPALTRGLRGCGACRPGRRNRCGCGVDSSMQWVGGWMGRRRLFVAPLRAGPRTARPLGRRSHEGGSRYESGSDVLGGKLIGNSGSPVGAFEWACEGALYTQESSGTLRKAREHSGTREIVADSFEGLARRILPTKSRRYAIPRVAFASLECGDESTV